MTAKGFVVIVLCLLAVTAIIFFGTNAVAGWTGIRIDDTPERPLDTIAFHGPTQIIQFEGRVSRRAIGRHVTFWDVQGTKHVFSPPFTIEYGKE